MQLNEGKEKTFHNNGKINVTLLKLWLCYKKTCFTIRANNTRMLKALLPQLTYKEE